MFIYTYLYMYYYKHVYMNTYIVYYTAYGLRTEAEIKLSLNRLLDSSVSSLIRTSCLALRKASGQKLSRLPMNG